MAANIAKLTDLFGILISVYLARHSYFIIANHLRLSSSVNYAPGVDPGFTMYALIAAALYCFYRSLCYRPNTAVNAIPEWSVWRLMAWPMLIVAFGIANLLQDNLG